MHVLLLAEDFPASLAVAQGGVRVSQWRQAAGLASAGTRMTVLSPRRLYPPLRHYRETGVPLVPPSTRAQPAPPPPFPVLRPRILHLPLIWPITEPIQILVAGIWTLSRHARDIDLVHGHRAFPMGLAAVILGRLFQRPSVVTVHGTEVNVEAEAGPWLLRRLVRAALAGASRVIAVSRALGKRLPALGVEPARVRLVPSGVDLDLFAPADRMAARQELGLPADRFIFVAPSMFDTVKGHRVLIEAMALLARRRPDAFLAMPGDGGERPRIERRARELGLDHAVRFGGLVAHSEQPRWMNAADALVLPSFNEGMPLTVIEGFACGKPLVGSQVGGVPELVVDERYGILVPPGDPDRLAAALESAIDRHWDAATIRDRAQEFDWPLVVERVRGVYEELLRGD